MKTKTRIYIGLFVLLFAVQTFGSIVTLDITPSDTEYGQQALYELQYTAAQPGQVISSTDWFEFTFTSEFNLAYLTAITFAPTNPESYGAFESTWNIVNNASGQQKIRVRRDGTGVTIDPGDQVTIYLSMITNPENPTPADQIKIATYKDSDTSFSNPVDESNPTTVVLQGPIVSFDLYTAAASITAGTTFILQVINAVDGHGNPAGIPAANPADNVNERTVRIELASDQTAPDGTAPVVADIIVENGTGGTGQTLYNAASNVQFVGTLLTDPSVTDNINISAVSNAAVDHLDMTGYPATIDATNTFPDPVVVTAQDVYNNTVTNYTGTVSFTTTSTRYTLPNAYTFVSGDLGQRSFSGIRLQDSGNQTITVNDGTRSITSDIIVVNGGDLSVFTFDVSPELVIAGEPVTLSITGAQDASGNPLNESFALAFDDGGTHTSPNGETPVLPSVLNVVNGSGSVQINLFNAELSLTINATANSITRSVNFDVQPGSLEEFDLAGVPVSVDSGATFTNDITVTALDDFGNVKTNYTGTVQFTSTDTKVEVDLPSSTTLFNGVRAFPGADFSLHTVGNQTITVADISAGVATESNYIQVKSIPTDIEIVSITPSQTTVTQGQTADWTVQVVVRNNSTTTPIQLSSNSTQSYIQFKRGTVDTGYDITGPTGTFSIPATGTTTLTYTVNETGTMTGTLDIFARVATISGDHTTSTLDEVYSGVEVQTPEIIQIVSATPSQPEVVAGDDTHSWTVTVEVENTGGSTVDFDFTRTSLVSSAQVTHTRPSTFTDLSTTLAPDESKTMVFTVTENGTTTGTHNLNVRLSYQVQNTLVVKEPTVSSGASVEVVSASNLQITDITPSRNTISIGSSTEWDIVVDISNNGGSDVEIDFTDTNTWLKFYSASAQELNDVDLTWPTDLEIAGGTTLAAGSTDQLIFHVTSNTFSSGTMNILGRVQGTEANRNMVISDVTVANDGVSGTVVMQTPPNVTYVSGSLQPRSVFPGTAADFQMSVSNSGGATVQLDEEQTTIEFSDAVNGGSHVFSATLDPGYGTTIGSGTTTLHFNSKNVPSEFIANDSYPVTISLNGVENGSVYTRSLTPGSDLVTVGEPGDLTVTGIRTSTGSVTVGQTNSWTAVITVENNDISDMRLQNVSLTFNYSTDDVTNYFTYTPATTFLGSGTGVLASDGRDSINVTISAVSANAPTGAILVSTEVGMVDANDAGRQFTDQLYNAAQIMSQSPADIVINSIRSSQPTITRGQTVPWTITAKVTNIGQSEVQLRTGSLINFSRGNQYFTVTAPTAFSGNGTARLVGGGVDSLVFTVTNVSSSVSVGPFTVNATILTDELNTGRDIQDQSSSISLSIQENASIRIDNVFADLRSNTLVNTNQEFYVQAQVSNVGGDNGDMVEHLVIDFSAQNNGITFPNGNTVTLDSVKINDSKVTTPGILVRAPNLSNFRDVVIGNISSAIARNTGQSANIESPLDNSAEFTTQNPGILDVLNVTTENDTIVSGTQAPWAINVTVSNTGTGTILLKKPQDTDISINREGYVIKASEIWTDSLLTAGETQVLNYTVTNTPSVSGIFTVTANIRAQDWNDPAISTFTESGQTQVYFTKTSAVGITETYIDPTTPNIDEEGVGLVNTGQTFNVRVKIENKADQGLDSVRVRLLSQLSSVQGEILVENIGFGEDKEGVFTVIADDAQNLVGEKLRSEIVYAYGQDGTQSKISQAEDDSVMIKIYNPAQLQIVSTKNLAPNPDKKVSQSQTFPVEVKVANYGSEAAKEVRLSMMTSSTLHATVQETPLFIEQEIAGGDTGTVIFTLQAGNSTAAGKVNIYASLFDAKGKNDNQQPDFLDGGDNDTTFADLEKGAEMLISNLVADVDNGEIIANYSQAPWNLYVELFNDGEADVQLTELGSSNVTFVVDGQEDNTYDVRPPVKLRSSGDLILRAGQTDTLAFSIAENGEIAGNAVIKVNIHGEDMNVGPANDLQAIDSTNVYVISEAVVQIVETTINSNEHDEEEKGLVNRGQEFEVHVLVRAGQLLGVDSVKVMLTTDGNSMLEPDTVVIDSINRDSESLAIFTLTADDTWSELDGEKEEVFSATILSALSKDTQLEARIRKPDKESDALATMRIQRQANLALELLFENEGDSVLTLAQDFNVLARIRNLGSAQTGNGKVTLTPPEGYSIKIAQDLYTVDPTALDFQLVDAVPYTDVQFVLKSPAVTTANRKILGEITTIPVDLNINEPAIVTTSVDSIYARTSSSNLVIDAFEIFKPVGATDGILSTVQSFTMRAIISSTTNLQNRQARLEFPDNLPGDVEYNLISEQTSPLVNSPDTIEWVLTAPEEKFDNLHKFRVFAEAVEAGVPKTVEDSLTIVSVEKRANIAIEAFESQDELGYNEPREREAYFSKDQKSITLRARIKNQGEANVYGNGIIRLDLGQSNLTLAESNTTPLQTTFTGETESVEWIVDAGAIDTDGKDITVEIVQAPRDTNTNEYAKTVDDATVKEIRVFVQELGRIRINNDVAEISSPSGAKDNIISTDQTFYITTEVNSYKVNPDKIAARLVTPATYKVTDKVQSVPMGFYQEVTWEVTAPAEHHILTDAKDTLYVEVTAEDEASGVELVWRSDSIFVHVVEKTKFKVEPRIVWPNAWPEEQQEVVSTYQDFDIEAYIRHDGAQYMRQDSFVVKISAPPEFEVQGNKQQVYRWEQFNNQDHPTWRITAPRTKPTNSEASSFTITLLEAARDTNSYQMGSVQEDSVRFSIFVVERALVNFDSYLLGQQTQDTSSVRIGSNFKAVCKVTNLGAAKMVGAFSVKINLPSGYTSADTLKQALIQDGFEDSLTWNIKAPNSVTSGLSTISFTLVDPPNDQYTHANASTYNTSDIVKVKLETGKLIAQSYKIREKTAVIKGGTDVPMMGLVFRNKDISSQVNTYLNKLFFTFKNREGEVISASSVVKRVVAYQKPADPKAGYTIKLAETTDFTDTDKPGQVMLDLRDIRIDTIKSAEQDTVDILVDILSTDVEDFRMTMSDSLPIIALDDNNQQVELADVDGNPISYLLMESDLAVIVDAVTKESFYNYPNPFGRADRPSTKFIYYLEDQMDVTLQIFTMTGDLVLKKEYLMTNGDVQCESGLHQGDIEWDGRNGKGHLVLNGVYFAYLSTSDGKVASTKVVVVK